MAIVPSLDDLPVWVREGDAIWPALLGVAAIAGPVIAWLRRRRATPRMQLPTAVAPDAWANDAIVTVEGTLRGGPVQSVAALGFARGRAQEQLGNTKWPDARLEADGGVVALDGELAIQAGTRSSRRGYDLRIGIDAARKATGARLLGRWRGRVLGFDKRTIEDGDRVRATGRIVRRAATAAAGYREDAGRWVLVAADMTIDVIAMKPVRAAPPLTRWHAVRAMVASLAGVAAILFGLAAVLPPSWTIVAALPGGRERVLDAIAARLADEGPTRAADLALLAGIDRERAGCTAAVDTLARHGQLDDALATARSCALPDRALELLVALGRYPEAADLAREQHDLSWAAELAYLATDDWKDAAAIATAPLGEDPSAALSAITADDLGRMTGNLVCFASALATRIDPSLSSQLEALGQEPGAEACTLLAADLTDDDDMQVHLLSTLIDDPHTPPAIVALADEGLVLANRDVPWPRGPTAAELARDQVPTLALRSAYAGLANRFNNDETKPRAAAGAAVFAWIAGDHARARSNLDNGMAWMEGEEAQAAREAMAAEVAAVRGEIERMFAPRPPENPYRLRAEVPLSPVALAWRAARERDSSGDPDVAAAWQAVANRQLEVLQDPKRALLFEVLALNGS